MVEKEKTKFKCVIHGSFGKHFDEIKRVHELFTENGIDVLAPSFSGIKNFDNGFAILESDKEKDPRMIELIYLHNLKKLGEGGFSYFVNPKGYIGKSASYELGIAQLSNVPCFFREKLDDHPAYLHKNSVFRPEELVEYILENKKLPEPKINRKENIIHKMWQGMIASGSVVAVGGIIEYQKEKNKEKEILLVKTHQWGGRYSIIGGRINTNERLDDALIRQVKEESGLKAYVGDTICVFDQFKNSGYYMAETQYIFIDKVVRVSNKKVSLNEEAEEYIWLPASIALKELNIEPNARHTLEIYSRI